MIINYSDLFINNLESQIEKLYRHFKDRPLEKSFYDYLIRQVSRNLYDIFWRYEQKKFGKSQKRIINYLCVYEIKNTQLIEEIFSSYPVNLLIGKIDFGIHIKQEPETELQPKIILIDWPLSWSDYYKGFEKNVQEASSGPKDVQEAKQDSASANN